MQLIVSTVCVTTVYTQCFQKISDVRLDTAVGSKRKGVNGYNVYKIP